MPRLVPPRPPSCHHRPSFFSQSVSSVQPGGQEHILNQPHFPLPSLTPGVGVNVLLAGDEQACVEGREHKAVVPGLPEELDVGGVGDTRHGDAVAVLVGSAERLWDLLLPDAPVGGQEGGGAQEEGGHRLEKGEARGAYSLKERHWLEGLSRRNNCKGEVLGKKLVFCYH